MTINEIIDAVRKYLENGNQKDLETAAAMIGSGCSHVQNY